MLAVTSTLDDTPRAIVPASRLGARRPRIRLVAIMTTTQASVNAAPFLTTAGLSNRLLARRLFDNSRLQREGRRLWANILELMTGEIGDHAMLNWRSHQLAEVAIHLAHLDLEAAELHVEIARRRQTGGGR